MWTNVFKIGGLHQISWFQFLPHESDLNPMPDKSVKVEQKDAATLLVLSSHLQLQKGGFLSTWTNSFVGPWDPSQGLHNPDEKIKLWLFLPGRHSTVTEGAQHAVSKLRILASGLWLAPGDSEEIATALSQALRNRIERALTGLSYVRFGDVFSRYHPFSQSEELFRRGQPVVEFIFAATEEAVFVHVVISAKHIRALSGCDVERTLKRSSSCSVDRLPVIVSPHGMRGRLSGCCPGDLVRQAYLSSGKYSTSNGIVGLPNRISQGSGCQLRGQNCYIEVTLGYPSSENSKALQLGSNSNKNFVKHHIAESPAVPRGVQKGSSDLLSVCEKAFIYPAEAVLVPVLHTSFARSSLKRFWLQNWIGPSFSASSFYMHCSAGEIDFVDGSWIESNEIRVQNDNHSSSNSNSSSISSISSTSSDSDYKMTTGGGDLEADVDSLDCRHSGLSSNDQLQNDGPKSGSKRPRTGMTESFSQLGTVSNAPMQDACKSDYVSIEVNNSAITAVANEVGSHWDWDDDDRGAGMDIEALLSEFGDFGDFFENDALPFGEVRASSVISLLQSDMKTALKTAFGNLDGPLSVMEWCRGRNQSGDAGSEVDGFSAESAVGECRDSSSTASLSVGEPISPSHSAGGSSCLKVSSTTDGARVDEISQRRSNQEICMSESEQQLSTRLRPTLFVLPLPAILVGYQDDWLKTSASSLQLWEKAPFEPYAQQKPMTYYVVCPDIDPLTTAAADFFQQLGTVYETCKLGTHSPQSLGNQMEIGSGKCSSSGFVLLDCPQSMKIESSTASLVGSISDYFLSLSNGWDLTSFLKSLSKVLRALKLGSCLNANPKEGNSGPCTVIYVVCPFPEPIAVLQTVLESSVAVGSIILSSDKERRSIMLNQVGKALSCSAAVDEASIANVLTLSGFSIPKLVLQIVTVDAIFRVTSPALSELVILKEIAFTVYNKARRFSRGSSNDVVQSSSMSGRSHSVLMQMSSPIQGMWKDCVGPRIAGPSVSREGELDTSLRSGAWDNSWQTSRTGGLGCDPNGIGDFFLQDEIHYMFEPQFILAEPGSLENGVLAPESSKPLHDDSSSGSFMQSTVSSGSTDAGPSSQLDGSEPDSFISGLSKTLPSLHCCYGWTEDWRWLVCIWTDSRGELLDSHIFPFGGISSRQDTKGLQSLFVQILQQGCQILQTCSSSDTGFARPRDFVITRIGCFYELECQEWQKALYSVGGSEVRKWPLQLRRSLPDGIPTSSNGTSLQQQEMSLIQERTLPSSPSPLYSPHSKTSGYMKGVLGHPSARKQLMGGHAAVDQTRGLLQLVQSISFVSISVDHSLHLVFQADSTSPGGTQGGGFVGPSGYLEGFTPVKSLGSASASYLLIPSPSMRFLPPTPLQLPTCLTAESPPLAHLLHSKGSAIPLSTGFVVSKAVSSMRKDSRSSSKEEWPSVLSVSLVDYYGGNNTVQEKMIRSIVKQGGRGLSSEARDFEIETHLILECVAAELHALSWMTVSPAYLERRTALPFHCDMVLRLRRLLHFADKELSRQPEK
ncbi:mediator of RNA polymerase II transcription subunit 13 isoform X4 [Cornus florida]|uniref:mediator of RNA polymerase II transcription subunit 13 isoform X4 n=1 Tax=Cornus florida TaxID=4283 RepID=UPI002896E0A9|nr:mediator of RNA polymerase II transcription subunit 13 isoform X4 [Cornus florida]